MGESLTQYRVAAPSSQSSSAWWEEGCSLAGRANTSPFFHLTSPHSVLVVPLPLHKN